MRIQLRNDERGVGHVVVVAVVVLVIAVVGVVGYRVLNKDKTEKKSVAVVKSDAAYLECMKAYKDKDLCKFTSKYDIEDLSFKMVVTSTGEDSGTMTMLSDGKGNSSLSTGSGGQSYEAISLDGATYMKGEDGVWIKYHKNDTSVPKSTDPTSDIKFDSDKSTAESSTTTYKKVGKEACGNLTCFKYQIVDSSEPGTTQTVWFDTKDYRMQRYATKDAKGSSDMVITYQSVKISAPTPVKEYSATDDAAAMQAAQDAAAAYSQ